MLKEIKIIDKAGEEIKPTTDNLVVLPFGNEKRFITQNEAENIIRVLRGQLNIIRAQNIERKTGCLEY